MTEPDIIVAGDIVVAPEGHAAALVALKAVMAETAKEAGCIEYRFWAHLDTPGHFKVYEEWQSKDALKAHGGAPHMDVFRAALGEIGVISRDVKMIETSRFRQL